MRKNAIENSVITESRIHFPLFHCFVHLIPASAKKSRTTLRSLHDFPTIYLIAEIVVRILGSPAMSNLFFSCWHNALAFSFLCDSIIVDIEGVGKFTLSKQSRSWWILRPTPTRGWWRLKGAENFTSCSEFVPSIGRHGPRYYGVHSMDAVLRYKHFKHSVLARRMCCK